MGWPLCVALAASPIYHILADILVLQPALGLPHHISDHIFVCCKMQVRFKSAINASDVEPLLLLLPLVPTRDLSSQLTLLQHRYMGATQGTTCSCRKGPSIPLL